MLDGREKEAAVGNKRLDVWDYATRVEGLIDVGKYDEAATALDHYLQHPGMNAFEISSTFRQFDEVMQLGRTDRGRPILERLARAAERLRSGHIPPIDKQGTRAMLVRVADPSWSGQGIPDLDVHTKMGTVIAVTGSASTVRALIKDPVVIAVEESRSAGDMDCARSLPFIRIREKYPSPAGEYSESGAGVLVAMIDNGIDVMHEAFVDAAGQSRIVGIWDQQDKAGPPPEIHLRALLRSGGDRGVRRQDQARASDAEAPERRPRHARRQHRRRTANEVRDVCRRRCTRRATARRHFRR